MVKVSFAILAAEVGFPKGCNMTVTINVLSVIQVLVVLYVFVAGYVFSEFSYESLAKRIMVTIFWLPVWIVISIYDFVNYKNNS